MTIRTVCRVVSASSDQRSRRSVAAATMAAGRCERPVGETATTGSANDNIESAVFSIDALNEAFGGSLTHR
jgi:hypothetical protein